MLKIHLWDSLLGILVAGVICLAIWVYRTGGTWTGLVTPAVLAVAALIAYRQLEHARHTRCAELLLSIMKWWNSEEMRESRQLLWKMDNARDKIVELHRAKDERFGKVVKVGQFGEYLGVLVLRKYVDAYDIWLLFEDDWKIYYQEFTKYLEELKQLNTFDTTFCNFKLLCEELDKIHR